MAICDDFNSCVPDSPLPPGAPGRNLDTLPEILGKGVNLFIYLIYAVLLVSFFYYLTMGIYKLIFADDQTTMKVVKESLTRALMAVLGLILVSSFLFIIIQVLRLLGVSDADIRLLLTYD